MSNKPTRPEAWPAYYNGPDHYHKPEADAIFERLETENQRLWKALSFATTDLDPEDVALTWQIANGTWEPDPPRIKS